LLENDDFGCDWLLKCTGDGEVDAEEFMRIMKKTAYGY
jgi:hypothetical protein